MFFAIERGGRISYFATFRIVPSLRRMMFMPGCMVLLLMPFML